MVSNNIRFIGVCGRLCAAKLPVVAYAIHIYPPMHVNPAHHFMQSNRPICLHTTTLPHQATHTLTCLFLFLCTEHIACNAEHRWVAELLFFWKGKKLCVATVLKKMETMTILPNLEQNSFFGDFCDC